MVKKKLRSCLVIVAAVVIEKERRDSQSETLRGGKGGSFKEVAKI